jgi:hypothetical protein
VVRLEGQNGCLRRHCARERVSANGRQIEAQILMWLGHLDDTGAGSSQLARATDRGVGALDGLHGQQHAVLDHDTLPNAQLPQGLGYGPGEGDVTPLLAGGPNARQNTLLRQELRHQLRLGSQPNAFLLQGPYQ